MTGSLSDRIAALTDTRTCGAPGCKRAPAFSESWCPAHRIPWRRANLARDESRRAA